MELKQHKTKIVCTIGPAVASREKIEALVREGMDVARINLSHGTHQSHAETIALLKTVRDAHKIPLAIMLDTKGPEVRVAPLRDGQLLLKAGTRLSLFDRQVDGTLEGISLLPSLVVGKLQEGDTILFCDGYIVACVVEIKPGVATIEIQNEGLLKSYHGVNLPHVDLDLPAMTEQDRNDIVFGCKQGIDLLAASFIRSADHLHEIRNLLLTHRAHKILLIAKIENAFGVKNFDSILQASDGIMIARGDLGVELSLTEVPRLQKYMIKKCHQAFKPVVTATQMLESMMHQPRPTRAEVSDVANAIYDGSSAVMLSGETAAGDYPVEAVKMMRNTILETEQDIDYARIFYKEVAHLHLHNISSSVALAAVKTIYSSNGKALIALTTSGFTARVISRFQPSVPIIAITPDHTTYHQLAFCWGVIPLLKKVDNLTEGIETASCFLLDHRLVSYGELMVITSGAPFGVSGTTNMMVVENIGDVLVRGAPSSGRRVDGVVVTALSLEELLKKGALNGKILVVPFCCEELRPFLVEATALILQCQDDEIEAQLWAKQLTTEAHLPLLTHAEGACSILREGQSITLEPTRGLIFDGVIRSDADAIAKVCKHPLPQQER